MKKHVADGIYFRLMAPMAALVLVLGLITGWMFRAFSLERTSGIRESQEAFVAENLKSKVQLALRLIEQWSAEYSTDLDQEAVQAETLEKLRMLRLNEEGTDYFWVHTFDKATPEKTIMLMHPLLPELEGTDVSDYLTVERLSTVVFRGKVTPLDDPEVAHISKQHPFCEMNRLCLDSGDGTLSYYWPKPMPDGPTAEAYPKMSYVGLYEPWNWVIGTGDYIDHIDAMVLAEQKSHKEREGGIFLTFAIALALALLTGLAVSNLESLNLSRAHSELSKQLERNEEISAKLESQNAELQAALEEVKTLSGLLPICSYCKKIRDDQGYWNQMEAYITKRSEAQFSHGICPECLAKHFPDSDGKPKV